MRPPAAREPGLALAALARADVTVQLIADGHHVAADALRVAWAAAPGRVALVTDATAAAAAGDGAFTLGGRPDPRRGRRGPRRAPAGSPGSALTMDAAVRHVHAPRRAAPGRARRRLHGPRGHRRAAGARHPAPGTPADVVVLDDRLEVVRTLVGGVAA